MGICKSGLINPLGMGQLWTADLRLAPSSMYSAPYAGDNFVSSGILRHEKLGSIMRGGMYGAPNSAVEAKMSPLFVTGVNGSLVMRIVSAKVAVAKSPVGSTVVTARFDPQLPLPPVAT